VNTIFLPDPRLLDSPRGRDWPRYPQLDPRTRSGRPPGHADVVIVGSGLAGLAVISALWHLGVHNIVVLDRDGRPAQRFFDRIDTLHQRVLRSPYEHHPGVEGYRDCELLDFARLHWDVLTPVERREVRMAQASHRSVVPVDVFQAYCHHVATIHHAGRRTWTADVREVIPHDEGVIVRTGDLDLTARYVVLCLGEQRRPAPAGWAVPDSDRIGHWDEPVPPGGDTAIVMGAGLTSAHLITNALAAGQRVHWVIRDAERYQCSDVNASFFRAEGRARFDGVPWTDRLALMRRERRASVMFEFRPLLTEAEADGRLTVHRGHVVTGVTADSDGATVALTGGRRVHGDHLTLALGTVPSIGLGLLPEATVGERDGFPDLDGRTLAYRRAPRVFAAGAAAGMVLGPAARNIDGHRVATARIAAAIAGRLSRDGVQRSGMDSETYALVP
jgi:cation diffusion facilitator CzcD-associated flavoprotein CzcO